GQKQHVPEFALLRQIPSIGPIRSALLVDPHPWFHRPLGTTTAAVDAGTGARNGPTWVHGLNSFAFFRQTSAIQERGREHFARPIWNRSLAPFLPTARGNAARLM